MNGDLESESAARHDLTRQEVLGALALGLPAGAAGGGAASVQGRPGIAALVTEYRKASHGQGIVDRFLDGYGWQGRHHQPLVDVVALSVDQKPRGDLSQERASRHPGLTIYPTIAEALIRGTGKLAVDGVLLIGERRGHDRVGPGPLPCRANPSGQRRPRELPQLEAPGPSPPRHPPPRRPLSAPARLAFLQELSERVATDLTPMGLRPMIGYDRTSEMQGF